MKALNQQQVTALARALFNEPQRECHYLAAWTVNQFTEAALKQSLAAQRKRERAQARARSGSRSVATKRQRTGSGSTARSTGASTSTTTSLAAAEAGSSELPQATVADTAFLDVAKGLIQTRSWWDSVDTLASAVGYLVLLHPSLRASMDEWIDDKNMWVRRVALIHQLKFKDDTDQDRLFRYHWLPPLHRSPTLPHAPLLLLTAYKRHVA